MGTARCRIRTAANLITLGRREDLYRDTIRLRDVSFVDGRAPADRFGAAVRIRHRAVPIPGHVDRAGDAWEVELAEPAWAPAPGQAAVLYDGDVVIGGGRLATPD